MRYVTILPDEFKTQVDSSTNAPEQLSVSKHDCNQNASDDIKKEEDHGNINSSPHFVNNLNSPKPISTVHSNSKEALRLSKNYNDSMYKCLNEKGKEILVELESLDLRKYSFAAASLCRSLLEYTIRLWLIELNENEGVKPLPTMYNQCIHLLQDKKIITSKEHTVLNSAVKKENFIELLNVWIHADTDVCVAQRTLESGWKNIRLLIEKYIDTRQS